MVEVHHHKHEAMLYYKPYLFDTIVLRWCALITTSKVWRSPLPDLVNISRAYCILSIIWYLCTDFLSVDLKLEKSLIMSALCKKKGVVTFRCGAVSRIIKILTTTKRNNPKYKKLKFQRITHKWEVTDILWKYL